MSNNLDIAKNNPKKSKFKTSKRPKKKKKKKLEDLELRNYWNKTINIWLHNMLLIC